MDNIVLNIVSKKQNLSYPLIFSKIGKYYWNETELQHDFRSRSDIIIPLAVQNKWYKILKILLHHNNSFALCYAAENGHLQVVKFLVENGADMSTRDYAPFRWAVYFGHLEVVKYLVKKGCDIYTCDGWALYIARKKKYDEIYEFLTNYEIEN